MPITPETLIRAPELPIDEATAEIVDEFAFFDDWMDRYQHIIELGRTLDDLPQDWKVEENKLQGCQSQVWLVGRWVDGRLHMAAISDAAIVSGLIAIVMRIYNHRTAEEIKATPPGFIAAIGLDSHLSPTRSNGLNAMLKAVFAMAETQAGRGAIAA
ncbi:MAG: SufE family protein [Azospirillaceae bacterium]